MSDSMELVEERELERACENSVSEYIPEETSEQSAKKKPKGDEKRKVTDYFIVENDAKSKNKNDKQGKCTLCKTKSVIIKMKNCGTSSLRRHLQFKHVNIYNEFLGNPKQKETPLEIEEASNSSATGSTIASWLSGGKTSSIGFEQV